jgi:hypothetical protein
MVNKKMGKKESLKDNLIFIGILLVIITVVSLIFASVPLIPNNINVDGRIIKVVACDDGLNFNITIQQTNDGILQRTVNAYSMDNVIKGYTGRMYIHMFGYHDLLLYHWDGIWTISSITILDDYQG